MRGAAVGTGGWGWAQPYNRPALLLSLYCASVSLQFENIWRNFVSIVFERAQSVLCGIDGWKDE